MAERAEPAMTRHISNVWGGDGALPELIESAEAVERMLVTTGWRVVQRVLAEEIAMIDRELDAGPAKEAADYAKQHGRRSALRSSEEAARAVIAVAARRRTAAEQRVTDDAGESVSERIGA